MAVLVVHLEMYNKEKHFYFHLLLVRYHLHKGLKSLLGIGQPIVCPASKTIVRDLSVDNF